MKIRKSLPGQEKKLKWPKENIFFVSSSAQYWSHQVSTYELGYVFFTCGNILNFKTQPHLWKERRFKKVIF